VKAGVAKARAAAATAAGGRKAKAAGATRDVEETVARGEVEKEEDGEEWEEDVKVVARKAVTEVGEQRVDRSLCNRFHTRTAPRCFQRRRLGIPRYASRRKCRSTRSALQVAAWEAVAEKAAAAAPEAPEEISAVGVVRAEAKQAALAVAPPPASRRPPLCPHHPLQATASHAPRPRG